MVTRIKTNIGFGLACLVIGFATVSSNITTSEFIEDSRWMTHALEVRSEVEKLSTSFVTAQNNIRGYHITEQNYYRDHYYVARKELKDGVANLRLLTKDNMIQQKNLDEIEPSIDEKLTAWDKSFEIRKKLGFDVIRKMGRTAEVKSIDDSFRQSIEALINEENRLLARRTESTFNQARRTQLVIGVAGVLACLLIVIAAFLVYRDSRRRELAEDNVDRFFTLSLDLLCISGMDGFFKRLSPSFSEVLGYSLKDLCAEPVVNFVHPEDVQKTNDEITSQMKGNKVLSFENRFRRQDGTYRTFSWKSVPVDNLMYAVARDVTIQKQHEADLMEAREIAQKATMAKSSFLANMSHEIRTPLNGVVGMTDILARTSLDPQQKKFVDAVKTSATSLLKIVNEILDFSKIEAGQVHLETVDFELGHLIEEHISMAGVLALNKGIHLETEIDPAIPPVLRGDSAKVSQILLNFINNAIKFTKEGSIVIAAKQLEQTPGLCKVKISVKDTGIGIDPNQVPSLFQPFVQADNSTARRFGGTGLGLSICKRFTEVMNGEIGVDTAPGEGSTFWIIVNLGVSELKSLNGYAIPKPKESLSQSNIGQKEIEHRKKIRILIAEDNRMNQLIIMNMMAILGYTAILAENGEDAIKLFSESNYDMVLMDQHMPVMDGIQSSTEIRKLETGTSKRIPIIAFTATVVQDEQKGQFKDLMDDFLLKPVSLEALESMLMKWEESISNKS
jgi:PAS domain S-box-containing protein